MADDILNKIDSESAKFLCEKSAILGRKNKKKFSWRIRPTPYKTFVAEFFLQRTGAVQVSNVFPSFIERFPRLKDALNAEPVEIKTLMKPLGLNHRGEAFVRALSEVKTLFKGHFPKNEAQLLKIFGVGKYIARAVLCFGFGKRVGLIDPNIVRVLTRYFGISEVPTRPHTSNAFWNLSDEIMKTCENSPKFFNWGMLDIGREICLPKRPKNSICPLQDNCRFNRERPNEEKTQVH